MLTKEEIESAAKGYEEILEKNKIKKGLVYHASFTLKGTPQGMPNGINDVVFNVDKPYLSMYPCIFVTLLSDLREVATMFVIDEKHSGEETIKEDIENRIGQAAVIDSTKFGDVLKALKFGEVHKEIYLGERDKLAAQLGEVEKIIKENKLE